MKLKFLFRDIPGLKKEEKENGVIFYVSIFYPKEGLAAGTGLYYINKGAKNVDLRGWKHYSLTRLL